MLFRYCTIISVFLVMVVAHESVKDQPDIAKLVQGPPGKRGAPGEPGNVIHCDCSSSDSKICQQVQQLKKKVERVQENKQQRSSIQSCQQIKSTFPTSNTGLHELNDVSGDSYKAYCDMETDGGGWTLVASVHDNNPGPTGRCTVGDKWSSEQGNNKWRPKGDGNWANLNVFGRAITATNEDLKNPGYFDINAKDVMIWHVPNNTPLRNFSSSAYLKYRTNSGFLSRYGGNLFQFFSKYFPLESKKYTFPTDSGPAIPVVFDDGSKLSLLQLILPHTKKGIEPGYIQFRTISAHTDAFALCPGFRLKTSFLYPGHGCLGSTGWNQHIHYCGDTTTFYEGTPAFLTGWTADETLITTTYLIFYR